jgi:adenylosuccinate lyase
MRSFEEQRPFKDLLLADAELTAVLPPAEIERTFDLAVQLRNVDAIIDRVFAEQAAGDGLQPAGGVGLEA